MKEVIKRTLNDYFCYNGTKVKTLQLNVRLKKGKSNSKCFSFWVCPVYGSGVRTHDLLIVSRLPLPLDHGSQISKCLFFSSTSSGPTSTSGPKNLRKRRSSSSTSNETSKSSELSTAFSLRLA